jgi:carbon-monoxide dehydrogenase large subunit
VTHVMTGRAGGTVTDVAGSGRPQALVGARVKRVEDPALLRGEGKYVDDVEIPGMLHAAYLRSPVAHARLRSIDMSDAAALPGVVAVISDSDVREMGIGDLPAIWVRPGQKSLSYPLLARDTVRWVGEPIAAVVAESRELAEDALELIHLEFDDLPAVVGSLAALEPEAPLLYDEWGDNVCVRLEREGGDVEQAFAEADVVLSERFRTQRYSGIPLETRGAVANVEPTGRGGTGLTIWSSTQVVHHVRDIVARVLNWPENRLRVIALDVGGGFGPKDHTYPEEIVTAALAIRTQRPVKWIEDRREHMLSTVHARDQVHDVEVAARHDGFILGIRDRMVSDIGACASNVGAGPVSVSREMLPGPYQVPNYRAECLAVVTNKVPAGAYRGFGMPESTFVMERMIDRLARHLDLDPTDVRRRNFVPPDKLPNYQTVSALTYDSGDYPSAHDRALALIDYEGWRKRQRELREHGRYIGIGISSYVEMAAFGPSRTLRDLGFAIAGVDSAIVKVDRQGKVTVFTGINSTGQSHQTAFAQVCADELGIGIEDVTIVQGDTASCPYADAGAIASRGAAVAGGATWRASHTIKEKMQAVAAHLLEASPEDMESDDGRIFVRGSPGTALSFGEVAEAALMGHDLPDDMLPGLEDQAVYDPAGLTYPYATHIVVVEVDPATGALSWQRYVVVHDCGTIINPTVVEGQIHGGIAQGLGGALLEEFVYSDDGQPLSTSFMDYLLPTATDVPDIEVEHTETPSPANIRGIKGMGEGGAIAPPAAVGNAIEDALRPFGVKVAATPLSPAAVWQLIQDADS